MHAIWRFSGSGRNHEIWPRDALIAAGRLYYVAESGNSHKGEVGCLAQTTGKPIWHYALVSSQTAEEASLERSWHITADSHCVYACECRNSGSPLPYAPYRLTALNAQTGALVWNRPFRHGLLTPPCLVSELLLFAEVDGTVVALRCRDGSTVWQRRFAATDLNKPDDQVGVVLNAAGQIGVIQTGVGRLQGFRVSDGRPIWEYLPGGTARRDAETGEAGEFALKDGGVYALLKEVRASAADDCIKLAAIQAATGKLIWARKTYDSDYGSTSVSVIGDRILVLRPTGVLVAVRRTDGSTIWFTGIEPIPTEREAGNSFRFDDRHDFAMFASGLPHTVFVVKDCDPVVGSAQRALLSVPSAKTVIALDLDSGREEWRLQPKAGDRIDKIVSDNGRLYLVVDGSLVAFEDGAPDRLPADPEARRRLALRMMNESVFDRRRMPWLNEPDPVEAQLTLLRLGRDSVSLLLDHIHRAVDESNANLPPPALRIGIMGAHLLTKAALNLLFDLDDPATVPDLAVELDRAQDPGMRRSLAESLILWGDTRALPALFRYVESGLEERDARQDALYFIYQRVDAESAAGHPVSPSRADLTDFLLTQLTHLKAPEWLHCFATFELLKNRGDTAYNAAFATFKQERTVRWFPADATLTSVPVVYANDKTEGFLTRFQPQSICRDSAGNWWAAFYCDYLGTGKWNASTHLWIVQSRDKKVWNRPAFWLDLGTLCAHRGTLGNLVLSRVRDRLVLDWQEAIWAGSERVRTIPHHNEAAVEDLYRDSDHDGLPDLMEKEIGTDPANPDTNGNGIPDSEDKNPLYRPHALTEVEAIYQAVIEGICQYSRMELASSRKDENKRPRLIPFSGGSRPLVLPAPSGSSGVEILGYSGPVLFKPFTPEEYLNIVEMDTFSRGRFQHPYIDLDGRWSGLYVPMEYWARRVADPFAPISTSNVPDAYRPPRTFHEYFPYTISADHKRARVGLHLLEHMEGSLRLDIEVDKIAGRWLPVECRPISDQMGRHPDPTGILGITLPLGNRLHAE